MSSFDDLRGARLTKLRRLQEFGLRAYPADGISGRTPLRDVSDAFDKLSKKRSLALAGRVMALRGHGGSLFCDIADGSDRFQIYLKKDEMGDDAYRAFEECVDIGDFCAFDGKLFLTKRNEKSLLAKRWTFLAKSLRTLPEKWHGLQDVEERSRRRYLDLIANKGVRERFELRSRTLSTLRRLLDSSGFVEVETPMLHALAGGASAKPFKTHHNALDVDLYLRIAPELYLKHLLVGGFSKIYEIGRNFRNEGMDADHNPEFTTIELYEAFANSAVHRALIERILRDVVKAVKNTPRIRFQNTDIDFSDPFPVLSFTEGLMKYTEIPYAAFSEQEMATRAREVGISVEKSDTKAKLADKIFRKMCVSKLIQPTFIVDYPLEIFPLAKESETKAGYADAYQVVAAGTEIVKGFSELNDPQEQRRRFEAQEALRRSGDEEAQQLDEDFIEALEYGMPPAAGLGIGIDRLVMLFTDTANIRDVILFPTMRPRK